jgi:hypothetical protein
MNCVMDEEIDEIKRWSLAFYVRLICIRCSFIFLPLQGGVECALRGEIVRLPLPPVYLSDEERLVLPCKAQQNFCIPLLQVLFSR